MATPEQMYQCQTPTCGYMYDPDRGDRKGKIQKGTLLKICRKIGNVLSAAREKDVQAAGGTRVGCGILIF